jgi:multicomponent Na+:H+ antiporter subunit B
MPPPLIPRVVARLLIPFIVLFALYVVAHGKVSPGGAFQGGVLLGAAVILYGLVWGLDAARRRVPLAAVRLCLALGVLVYGGVGIAGLVLGAPFLDYAVLAADPVAGQGIGILLIEGGVTLTVAACMVLIYFGFAGRGVRDDGP